MRHLITNERAPGTKQLATADDSPGPLMMPNLGPSAVHSLQPNKDKIVVRYSWFVADRQHLLKIVVSRVSPSARR